MATRSSKVTRCCQLIVDVFEALAWRAAEVTEPDRGFIESARIILEFGLANLLWFAITQSADQKHV